MSVDEVLKQAGINVLVNTGVNVLGDVAIPGALEVGAKVLGDTGVDKALGDATEDAFKAFSDGTEDVLKTSSDALDGAADSLKLADDALDAGKAIPDVSDTAKVIENGTDVAKVANNGSDVAKLLDNSSDTAKAIENGTDVAKAIDNGTDVAKAIDNGTDVAKIIDSGTDAAKTINNGADTVKAIGDSADTAKAVGSSADTAKAAGHASDASKQVDCDAITEKLAEDSEGLADHSVDNLHTDDVTKSVKTEEREHDIVVDSYYRLTHDEELKKIPGQANHTNQNAVYKEIVPSGQASAVKLEGDVFKDKGSQHYKFHESLEKWWDQYRPGGEKFRTVPTDYEYSKAVEQAYIDAGLKPADAQYAVQCSKEQLAQWRILRKQEEILGRKLTIKEQRQALQSIKQTIVDSGGNNVVDEILEQYKVPRIPNRINLPKAE